MARPKIIFEEIVCPAVIYQKEAVAAEDRIIYRRLTMYDDADPTDNKTEQD